MMLALAAAAALVVPIAAGAGLGRVLHRLLRRRVSGLVALVAGLLVPALIAAAVTVFFPIVGLWDAITEGFLCGVGIVWTAHTLYDDGRNMLLTAGSVAAAFIVLEAGARLFLGSAPAYPIGSGPHFLLSTLLRSTGPDSPMFQRGSIPYFVEQQAMAANPDGGTMEERPPGAMMTREIVCSIAYGPAYAGAVDVSRERAEVFPDPFVPRADASRRVLHVGDSMVFGANVRRDQTFTVNLEKLDPETQHINAGISGMAPDDYFVVLRSWVARLPIDLVVMYLFAGNDMVGLDAPHPCSDWQSILVYEDGRAALRFPAEPKSDRRIGLQWLVTNSPLPFLGRVMIVAGSHLAAFSGAVLDSWAAQAAHAGALAQIEHLESILRTARDELRRKGIAFVVVALPHADAIDIAGGPSDFLSTHVSAMARKLDLPLLDATAVIRDALARGEKPIQPDRSHFSEEGHRLVANWLHEHLPRAAGLN
jgi:hypothetical protein